MRTLWILALGLIGCSSTPETATPGTDASASSAPSSAASTMASGTAAPTSTAVTTSAPTSTAIASAAPTTAPAAGPTEVAKDANALVLAITVDATGAADGDALKSALESDIASVHDIGVPTSKGITGNREVSVKLVLPKVVETKTGYEQKAQLVGVTTDGQCPLFDLNAKASIEANPKTPADVPDVRAAAIKEVFTKLEAMAKTLKPHGACTPAKPWK